MGLIGPRLAGTHHRTDRMNAAGDHGPYCPNAPEGVGHQSRAICARLVSVNDKAVGKWREIIAAFRENAGTTVELAYVDRDGQRRVTPFGIPHSIRTLLGTGPESRLVTIDGRDTVTIQSDPPETVSVRYREGTRVILNELIGRQHVPIQCR